MTQATNSYRAEFEAWWESENTGLGTSYKLTAWNAYLSAAMRHDGPKGEAKIHIERLLRQLDEYESDDDLEAVASEGSRDSREAHDKWLTRVRAREWIDSRDATRGSK